MRRALRVLFASVPLVVACGEDDRAYAPALDAGDLPCIDADGDGYGKDCALGPDCDDNDPTVTTQCHGSGGGGGAGGGGPVKEPCSTEGATRECKVILGMHNGVSSCFVGMETCEHGFWSACR